MKDEELNINSKNLPLRIALFVLAILVAVGAFSYGVMGIGRKEAGYQRIEGSADDEALLYQNGVLFQYYFDGSSDEIKAAVNELKEVYAVALKRAYKLLDADKSYSGFTNLATLNQSLGQELEVSEELYAVLTDAWAKTQEEAGYHMFAGALYTAWENILYLSEPEEFDPLNSEVERSRLERLAEMTGDLSNFDLRIVDAERHTVCVWVSPQYLALLRELELDGPILDLNLLHDAYELRLVKAALEAEGYGDGYLTTDSGLTVSLAAHGRGEYAFYGFDGREVSRAGTAKDVTGSASSQFRAFALDGEELGYYVIDGRYRHPYVTAGGQYYDVLLSSFALDETGDVVKACYQNILLFNQTDEASAKACAASADLPTAYTLEDGGKLVYTNAVGAETITAAADYGWSRESIG